MHPFPTSLEEMEVLLDTPLELANRILAFDSRRIRAEDGRLLVEASTVQWLCTWTRALGGRVRIEPVAGEAPLDALKRVSDTLQGALLGLLDERALPDIPKVALARYKEAFFKRQRSWPDLNAQDRASLLCLDNIPAAIGLPLQLYPQTPSRSIATRDQFENLVDQMIKAVTPEADIRDYKSSRAADHNFARAF
jgi:hypothetical protein